VTRLAGPSDTADDGPGGWVTATLVDGAALSRGFLPGAWRAPASEPPPVEDPTRKPGKDARAVAC
jgi:hypothetical protein